MPERTFIAQREKTAPGYKVSKERLTLLLGGNASGDFKIKPLLIYRSENPRALKNTARSSLGVIWRSNSKSWMTAKLFQDWFQNHFCPAVKEYCRKKNIANKILLLLDNAPSHPQNLNDPSGAVTVQYLPKNTTALIQPMDQGVIAAFKAYYLRRTFRELVQKVDQPDQDVSVQEFWKQYNIKNALENIISSWEEVKPETMNKVWRKLWPECVEDNNPDNLAIVQNEIIKCAQQLGFEEVTNADLIELLESQEPELTNDDLIELEGNSISSSEDEIEEAVEVQLSSKMLNEALEHIESGLKILTLNDPDAERSSKVSRGVNHAINCYKELYDAKSRERKQLRIEHFFKNKSVEKPTE